MGVGTTECEGGNRLAILRHECLRQRRCQAKEAHQVVAHAGWGLPLDMDPAGRIDLHLRCRVVPGRRADFVDFLREAIPFYEAPGGITVRLLQDLDDDHRFIELVHYSDEAAYRRDQGRVANDPTMKAYLARWRSLLAESAGVEVYRLIAPPSQREPEA